MPAPIIMRQESFGGNLGERLGQSLGQGLSTGLQELANQKLERMQKKNAEHELRSAFPELPEESVAWISKQPAKTQWEILQTLGQQRQEQEMSALQQMQQAQQIQQNPQNQMLQQEVNIPDEHYTPEVIQQLEKSLQSPEAQQQFPPEQLQQAQQNLQKLKQRLANPADQAVAPVAEKPKGIPLASIGGGIKKEEINASKQAQIEKANSKYIGQLDQYIEDARSRKELAEKALRLVEQGNVTNGLVGLIPERILTSLDSDDAEFITLVGQLANKKALELRGPVGKGKLEAAARTKASLNQPKNGQIKILKHEIEEANNAEALGTARDRILAENNGIEPANFETKIRKLAREILGEESGLPPASEYSDDAVIEVNGTAYGKDQSGQWTIV